MRAVMGVAMTGATRPLPCPLPSDGMLMQLPHQQLRQRLWVHAQICNACSPAGCVCLLVWTQGVEELNQARVGAEHGLALEGAVHAALQLLVCAVEVESRLVPALMVRIARCPHPLLSPYIPNLATGDIRDPKFSQSVDMS